MSCSEVVLPSVLHCSSFFFFPLLSSSSFLTLFFTIYLLIYTLFIFYVKKSSSKVKVKVTLVQVLRLCTSRTANRRSRGIALTFHDHGTRWALGVSVTPRPLFIPGKDSVPIVQEAGLAPGPVWTCAKNLAPTGIWSTDRPGHSQSLYPLSYPVHNEVLKVLHYGITLIYCWKLN